MEQYQNVVQDLAGNVVAQAVVRVLLPNGTPATVYTADGSQTTNPVPCDSEGNFTFQAANGRYFIQAEVAGRVYKKIGPIVLYDAAEDPRIGNGLTALDLGFGGLTTVATGTPAPGVSSQFFASRPISAHAQYAFLANSTVTYTTPGFYGQAGFNDNTKYAGSQDADHHHCFQAYPHYGSTGTMGDLSCFWALPDVTAGNVTELAMFKANEPSGAGAIANLYGLLVRALTRGANNWGLYFGDGVKSFFGGKLLIGQIGNPMSIDYNRNTGHMDIEPRAGYDVNVTRGNLRVAQAGKGIQITNAAGTITKTITLSADGNSLVLA